MSEPSLDDTTWPIVVVTFGESMSSPEVSAYFERLRGYLKRRERFGVVLDARRIRKVDAVRRKMHGDFLASIDGPDRFVAAAALVVEEEVQRGLLTAIFWIHKPRFPIERFEGLGEAMLWARDRVRDREEAARRSGFPSAPPPRPPSVGSMRAISVAPPALSSPSPPSSSHLRSAPAVPFVPSTSSSALSVPPPSSSGRISSNPPGNSAPSPAPSSPRISAFPPARERK